MEMLVTKFSKGKYRNESELFAEPVSNENVKLMGEMIALQALRTVKKFDMKVADKLYTPLQSPPIDRAKSTIFFSCQFSFFSCIIAKRT